MQGHRRVARGGHTILLVDDEPGVRHLLGQVLKSAGYAVLEADSSCQAVLVSGRYAGDIHLLLSDVLMPGCFDGVYLAECLKSLRPAMNVILMSGYASRAIDPRWDFIGKPFTPAAVLEKIEQLLGSRKCFESRKPCRIQKLNRR